MTFRVTVEEVETYPVAPGSGNSGIRWVDRYVQEFGELDLSALVTYLNSTKPKRKHTKKNEGA